MLALDTNVVVDILRARKPHLRTRLAEAVREGHTVIVSSLVLHELAFGAMVSARPDLQLERLNAFLDAHAVEPFTADDALSAARVRADLQRRGVSIEDFDVLIAGHALAREWTLVTANIRDFIRVEELTLLDWSDPEHTRAYGGSGLSPR